MQVSPPTPDLTDPRSPVPLTALPRPRNIRALTSIRFPAAFGVALYHMVKPPSRLGFFAPVAQAGFVGVSFFFLLSGFILTYTHAAEYQGGLANPARFWVARLARIYPVYLVVMLAAAYVNFRQFHPASHILAYLADLLMVQAWSMRLVSLFNFPAWSLSAEAFFYLLFPFLLLPLRPSSRARAILAFATLWAASLFVPLLDWFWYPRTIWAENVVVAGAAQILRTRLVPIFHLPEFLAGILLGWIYLRFDPGPRRANLLAVTGLTLLLAVLFFADHIPLVVLNNGLLLPAFALLILALCHQTWLSRLLAQPALVLLGEASFAFYLIHLLFNDWTKRYFGPGESLPATALKLAIITALSIVLHLAIERPGRRLILQWWQARHPEPRQATA